jgi:hypothetical protein
MSYEEFEENYDDGDALGYEEEDVAVRGKWTAEVRRMAWTALLSAHCSGSSHLPESIRGGSTYIRMAFAGG